LLAYPAAQLGEDSTKLGDLQLELVNLLTDSAKLPEGFSEDLPQLSDRLVDLAMRIASGRVRPGLLGY